MQVKSPLLCVRVLKAFKKLWVVNPVFRDDHVNLKPCWMKVTVHEFTKRVH